MTLTGLAMPLSLRTCAPCVSRIGTRFAVAFSIAAFLSACATRPEPTPATRTLESASRPTATPAVPVTVPARPSAQTADGERDREGDEAVATSDAPGRTPSTRERSAANEPLIRLGTGPLVAPKPVNPASQQGAVSLNFEAADVREVAKAILADILNQNYIVDPRVQGTVTLRTVRPMPADALLATLESALRLNGVVMVFENGLYKLMPAAASRGSVAPRLPGRVGGYTVQVVPLRFVGVREMARLLEPFAPEGGIVRQDDARNLLVIAGTQNEMQSMLDTIETFDVDWLAGMSFGLFTLTNLDARNVAQDFGRLLGERTGELLTGLIRVVPLERMNAILVITPQPRYLELARSLIERLDRSNAGGQQLYVYHVQNGRAENLAVLLSQVYGVQGPQQAPPGAQVAPGRTPTQMGQVGTSTPLGSGPQTLSSTGGMTQPAAQGQQPVTPAGVRTPSGVAGAGGEVGGISNTVRIVPDRDNNFLVILATAAEYEKIESALRRLDTIPRQVLIEVTLAEITLTDEMSFGVDWSFARGQGSGALDLGAAGISALTPGFSYVFQQTTGNNIKAALNALAGQNRVNVLSSPHVLVADNQAARIQVGDNVPVAGPQTVTGTGQITTSVQYVETGIILNVTPRINASGLVTLDINQEVSQASATTSSGLNSPTISKRAAKSIVTVQSGETMVLGGLISDQRTRGSAGLPLVSNIPVVGALFGSQNYKTSKTELVVLITPYIASNVAQAKAVSEEFRRKLVEIEPALRQGRPHLFTPPASLQESQPPKPAALAPSPEPRQTFALPER